MNLPLVRTPDHAGVWAFVFSRNYQEPLGRLWRLLSLNRALSLQTLRRAHVYDKHTWRPSNEMTRLPAGTIVLSHFLPLPTSLFASIAVVAPLYTGVQVVSAVVSAVAALVAVAVTPAVVVEPLVCGVGATVVVAMVLALLFVT